MSAHTPGPWIYAGRLGFGHLIDPNIAVAYVGETSGRADAGEANANLIAAAPEMLEALTAVKTLMSRTTVSDLSDEDAAQFRAIQWQVNVALSKARPVLSGGTGE